MARLNRKPDPTHRFGGTNPDLPNVIGLQMHSLLAALPAEGGYFDPAKLIVFALAVLLWAYTAAWVQQDIIRLRLPPGMWSPLVLGSGILGLFLFLLIPIFFVGLLAFAAVFGGAAIAYVLHRNKRVAPAQSVLTLAHLRRLGKGGAIDAEALQEGKDRTRIKDHAGKTPAWPKDPVEHAGYQAMQDLLFDAIWRRASDVRMDFAPQQPLKIIYRVDGVDRAREPVDAQSASMVLMHLKRISGCNVEEHRRPQSGKFKASIGAGGKGDKGVEVEVKTSGSSTGERMLLRLLSEEGKFRLMDIGLLKDQAEKLQAIVQEPKGVVLCSSPKAGGVTSTMYACLRAHDAFIQNIHTLELSKAMDLENITQHVFDSQDGTVTFGKRLRSILRTEPDVCLIGEMVDAETAAQAAAAGRQGKKIYMGVAAKDVFHALGLYMQAVADNHLVASSLLAVTSQRLARLLCTQCRKGYKPDPAILKKANLPLDANRPFYRPPNPNEIEVDKKGNPIVCAVCQGSGYLGRTGVFEILLVDDAVRNHISKGTPLQTIKTEVRKKGMLFLQEVALHKVYEGITSINEVLRVTKDPASAAPGAAPAAKTA